MLKYDFNSLISAVLFSYRLFHEVHNKRLPKVDPLGMLLSSDDFDFSVDHPLQYQTQQHTEDKTSRWATN